MDINTFFLYWPYAGEKFSQTHLEEEESLISAATKTLWIELTARKKKKTFHMRPFSNSV